MMDTMTVDVDEAKMQLSQLLSLALQGQEIVIAKNKEPLVRLVPIGQRPQRRIAGLNRGAMKMHDDFNNPLPDEFWLGEK
jgi:antitoxin (DNA-binding transcriptional repressor) of toxin-antitoxin stability system